MYMYVNLIQLSWWRVCLEYMQFNTYMYMKKLLYILQEYFLKILKLKDVGTEMPKSVGTRCSI